MVRVWNGLQRHKRHKKFRDLTNKLDLLLWNKVNTLMLVEKRKKREQRQIWIERLSAAMRMRWSTYSSFIAQCSSSNVQLNRKVLSNIALAFPKVFDSLVAKVSK